jgi:hypothetical protein
MGFSENHFADQCGVAVGNMLIPWLSASPVAHIQPTERDTWGVVVGKSMEILRMASLESVGYFVSDIRVPFIRWYIVNNQQIVDELDRTPGIVHGAFAPDDNRLSRDFLEKNGVIYNHILDYEQELAFVNFVDPSTADKHKRDMRLRLHMQYAVHDFNSAEDLYPVSQWLNSDRSLADAQLSLARRSVRAFSSYELPDSLLGIGDRMAKRTSILPSEQEDSRRAREVLVEWCKQAAVNRGQDRDGNELQPEPLLAADIFHLAASCLDSSRNLTSTFISLKKKLESLGEPLRTVEEVKTLVAFVLVRAGAPTLFRYARNRMRLKNGQVLEKGDVVVYLMRSMRKHVDDRRGQLEYTFLDCVGARLVPYLLEMSVLQSKFYKGVIPDSYGPDPELHLKPSVVVGPGAGRCPFR